VEQAGRIPIKVPCPAMVAMAAAADPDPVVTKVSETAPVKAAEGSRARRGKHAKRSRHVRVADNASKGKSRGHHARRPHDRTKTAQHTRKPSTVGRGGRTAMNIVAPEKGAQRM
jgi:hypothetical protein